MAILGDFWTEKKSPKSLFQAVFEVLLFLYFFAVAEIILLLAPKTSYFPTFSDFILLWPENSYFFNILATLNNFFIYFVIFIFIFYPYRQWYWYPTQIFRRYAAIKITTKFRCSPALHIFILLLIKTVIFSAAQHTSWFIHFSIQTMTSNCI